MFLLVRTTPNQTPRVFVHADKWIKDGTNVVFYKSGTFASKGLSPAKTVLTIPASQVKSIDGASLSS